LHQRRPLLSDSGLRLANEVLRAAGFGFHFLTARPEMANRQRSSSSAANCADGLGAIIPFTRQGGLRGPDFSQPALSALVFRSSPAGLPCALSPIQDVGKLEGVYLFSQSCDFDFIHGPSLCQSPSMFGLDSDRGVLLPNPDHPHPNGEAETTLCPGMD
jgi:hypothetical protein